MARMAALNALILVSSPPPPRGQQIEGERVDGGPGRGLPGELEANPAPLETGLRWPVIRGAYVKPRVIKRERGERERERMRREERERE